MEATPSSTLQRWREARHTLDHAIQNYLDTTMALQSDLYNHNHSGELTLVRNAMAEARLNDTLTPDRQSKLALAQARLNQTCNLCLPINTLPLEILLRIFRLSAFQSLHNLYNTPILNPFQHDNRQDLIALTHVCSRWRTIILSIQSFWSRFEFNTRENFGTAGDWARLYLDRAPDAPLSFYLDEHPDHKLTPVEYNQITDYLGPRLDRLAQMALINVQERRLAVDLVLFWLKHGKPGTLRTLTIRMDTGYWYSKTIKTTSLSRQRVKSFLGPICALYLNGLRFDWDSPVYQNLVVLRIGSFSEEDSPKLDQVIAIFSACPQLHTLQLFDMSIRQSHSDDLKPVYFPELENLSLTRLSFKSIGWLLPMIFPGPKDLTIRIGSPPIYEKLFFASVHSFLARNNVTRLYIQRCVDFDDISTYLSAVPNLHSLVINFDHLLDDRCISCFTRPDELNAVQVPICPQLHTLYLVGGTVSIGFIQRIVEAHKRIRKIRFSGCTIVPSKDELRRWLAPFVEDIRFSLEMDNAETFDWYHLMD